MFTLKNILILIGRNALITLVVIFMTLIGITFLSKKIKNISDYATLKNQQELELKVGANIAQTYNEDMQIVGNNYGKIEEAFLPSDNILRFTNSLDSLASINGVKQAYNFDTPNSSTSSGPFPISAIAYTNNFMTNISSFSNYLNYPHSLEC